MAGNTKRQSKSHPTWTDVKAKLADFDRAALLDLIRSLYSAHKDNQVFLHSRFGLGGDVLEPYKKIIDRVCKNQSAPWLWGVQQKSRIKGSLSVRRGALQYVLTVPCRGFLS